MVEAADWRTQQENDLCLWLVLQWLQGGQRSLWDDMTGLSITTKRLWAKFESLQLKEDVLQQAWRDPSMGMGWGGLLGGLQ